MRTDKRRGAGLHNTVSERRKRVGGAKDGSSRIPALSFFIFRVAQ